MLTLFTGLTPAGAVFLGLCAAGLVAIPALLFADAHRADFDPRPAVRRTTAVVHQAAVHAGHDLNRAIATGQRVARTAVKRPVLVVLNARDRTRLAVIRALLASARRLNAPKGTLR